jgi:hypothetical protein
LPPLSPFDTILDFRYFLVAKLIMQPFSCINILIRSQLCLDAF